MGDYPVQSDSGLYHSHMMSTTHNTTSRAARAQRRLADTLAIAGGATMAFGVWAMLKTVLLFVILDEEVQQLVLSASGIEAPTSVIAIIALIVAAIDLALRAYVGLCARVEGNGRHAHHAYLGLAAVLALGNMAAVLLTAMEMTNASISVLDLAVSLSIDVTSAAALALLVVSAVRLRLARRAANGAR